MTIQNNKMKYPLISILMGIYNCGSTLGEAIDSILNQTYSNWELILCDDGSKDNTLQIAKEYQDRYPDKIRILINEENLGLNKTLNKCLKAAKGSYIARMDGDDRCSPDRFKKELEAFETHPEIAIVSSDMQYFDEKGVWGRIHHPEYPQNKDFLHGTPFCHAPCLVKKEAFDAVGGYSESERLLRVEDYHLWMKMYAKGYKGMNLSEPLYQMRDDSNAYARRKFKYRLNEAYVKASCVKNLKLPFYGYLYSLKPILVGLMPNWLYDRAHKANLNK